MAAAAIRANRAGLLLPARPAWGPRDAAESSRQPWLRGALWSWRGRLFGCLRLHQRLRDPGGRRRHAQPGCYLCGYRSCGRAAALLSARRSIRHERLRPRGRGPHGDLQRRRDAGAGRRARGRHGRLRRAQRHERLDLAANHRAAQRGRSVDDGVLGEGGRFPCQRLHSIQPLRHGGDRRAGRQSRPRQLRQAVGKHLGRELSGDHRPHTQYVVSPRGHVRRREPAPLYQRRAGRGASRRDRQHRSRACRRGLRSRRLRRALPQRRARRAGDLFDGALCGAHRRALYRWRLRPVRHGRQRHVAPRRGTHRLRLARLGRDQYVVSALPLDHGPLGQLLSALLRREQLPRRLHRRRGQRLRADASRGGSLHDDCHRHRPVDA